MLAADFMRGRIRGDEDFAQAANAALGKNTDAMTQLIGDLFGAATAKKFAELWAEHVVELFTYARGLADEDDAVRDEAREELIEYEEDLAAFFVDASHGRLTTEAANRAMTMHVDHLLMQADAYAAGDYARPTGSTARPTSTRTTWAERGRRAASADGRGGAAGPDLAAAVPAGQALAEHVVLVEDVTRAAATNSPDFAAAGQLVNGNTRDLATAMDSLFGTAAAKDFQSLWATTSTSWWRTRLRPRRQDAARRDQARANLRDFESRMATFLEAATGKRLTSTGLADALLATIRCCCGTRTPSPPRTTAPRTTSRTRPTITCSSWRASWPMPSAQPSRPACRWVGPRPARAAWPTSSNDADMPASVRTALLAAFACC